MLLNDSTVLCIEEDNQSKEFLIDALKKRVKSLYFAKTKDEAIESFTKFHQDIVISETKLSDKNILEISEKIKELDKNQLIILFSGSKNIDDYKKAINIGINSFLSKPATKDELIAILDKNLQKLELKKINLNLQEREKVSLVLKLIHEISHHWRQSLAHILFLSSSFIIKKEMNLFKAKEDEIKDIDKISQEVKKLAKVLKELNDLDLKNVKLPEVEKLIKISNPLEEEKNIR
ncbi:response regulator [Halarcobacter anaerophilus]|nr:response regulator [Halarcobacter anaerophilus]QDF28341.1 response regulator receiver domain-containing protein [Halarcobacter anaerophilus]